MYGYLYWFAIYSPSYTIFVWSGFRSILRGDRLILRGGAGKLYRDRARTKKYFQVIRCQNTYLHPQQNLKRGGG